MNALPTIKHDPSVLGDEVHEHPAFGVITVARCSSTPAETLFGSELQHSHMVHVQINRAEARRSLASDHHYARESVVDFMMTESQWASFVSSMGVGNGTPVTLCAYRQADGQYEQVPGIRRAQQFGEKFKNDMTGLISERLEQLQEQVQRLEAMAESGSLSKTQIKDIAQKMGWAMENAKSTPAYVNQQFKHSMETVVAQAKTEIESFVGHVALTTGIKAIAEGGVISLPPQRPANLLVNEPHPQACPAGGLHNWEDGGSERDWCTKCGTTAQGSGQ